MVVRVGIGLSAVLWVVGFAGSKNSPGDAGVLGGKRDDRFLVAASSAERASPGAEPIGALGEDVKRGARPVHEQRSEVNIAAFGDASEARFVAGRVLAGHQPEPSTELAAIFEKLRIRVR